MMKKIKIRGNLYWCDSDNIKHPLEEISVKLYKDTGYKRFILQHIN